MRNRLARPKARALAVSLLLLLSQNILAAPLLNGLSPHTELGKEKFIAGLYLENLSSDAAAILQDKGQKQISLHITAKRLSHRSLKRMWIEGMAINTPGGQLAKYAKDTVAFAGLFKEKLTTGDVILIDSRANDGTVVSVNGVELGTFHTEGFFEVLLRTWIGSVPLSSDFRSQLLSNGDVDTTLLSRYEAIKPSDNRIAAIKDWNKPEEKSEQAPQAVASAAPAISAPSINVPPPLATEANLSEAEPALQAAATQTAPPEANSSSESNETTPAAAPPPTDTVATAPEEEAAEEELAEEEPELTAESLIARQLYHSSLLRYTYKFLSYPKRAVKRSQEGSVRVSVTIDREGKIKAVQTIEESKYPLLNREALRAVSKAEPFPTVPDAVIGSDFEFSLPIAFRLP